MITVIANLKGGTGKSTVTFNLAAWLSAQGGKIKVIDLDPQRTLSDVASVRHEEHIEPEIQVQSAPLPGARPLRLADETLIDVGTADLDAFRQALTVADRVLMPVTPSQADIWSTQRFIQFLSRATNGYPPEVVAFINRADIDRSIPASDEAAAALASLPGVRLIPQRLGSRTLFRDSFSEGLAVFELAPKSAASRELHALADVLFERRGTSASTPEHAGAGADSAMVPDRKAGKAGKRTTGKPDKDKGKKDKKAKKDKKNKKAKKDKKRTKAKR